MKPSYVGIIIACLYMVFKMVLYFLQVQETVLHGKTWMILLSLVLLGIFYSINHYIRTSETYDWMSAFKKGLTVSLTCSVFVGIMVFLYYKFIDINYLDNLAIAEYNHLKAQIPADKLADYNESLKNRYKANTFAIMTVSIVNIVGLIGSLIVGMLGRMTVKRA
jgi:hypothetical protein